MTFTLPPLPYDKTSLSPHLSEETLDYHYGKHHQAYVKKLNELTQGTEYENFTLEEVIAQSSGTLFNNAAQVWNHTFYWNSLSPNGGGSPKGDLAVAIETSFGSFVKFKDEFTEAAVNKFGSGWAWLVKNPNGRLGILTTSDAGCPLITDQVALLACDIWEHAYYIDYRNARPKYLKAFWELANWDFAAENLKREAKKPA